MYMHSHFSGTEPLKPDQKDSAGEQLYLLHAAVILAYIRLHISSEEDAEDLLLDVFLAALQSKDLFTRVEASQRAWLLAVARHKVIDWYRRKSRQQFVTLDQVITILYEDDAFSPEHVALQSEAYEQLMAMVKQLPSSQQQTVWLKFVYGLRCSEIAAVLGRKESTVRTWLSRALQSIRALHGER
jgi:RNA polymerase sigma factor (sigma-70 family)